MQPAPGVGIASAILVVDERGVEFVAQVGNQAREGGAGETMRTDQVGTRKPGASPVKQAVQAIEFV